MTDNKDLQPDDQIEDLTMSEAETANIKGGAAFDSFFPIDGIKGETDDRRSS